MPKDRERAPTFSRAVEDELDAAAEITPEDILRAQQAFRRDAAPAFRDLLDAPTLPPPTDLPPAA